MARPVADHQHRVAEGRRQKARLQDEQGEHGHPGGVGSARQKRRHHDRNDDEDHLEGIEHECAHGKDGQHRDQRRVGAAAHAGQERGHPAIGLERAQYQGEHGRRKEQRKQRAGNRHRIAQHVLHDIETGSVREWQPRTRTARLRRWPPPDRVQIARRHAAQQAGDEQGREDGRDPVAARGSRYCCRSSPCHASSTTPRSRRGRATAPPARARAVKHVVRVDDPRCNPGKIGRLRVRAQHRVTQQDQHQRGRHHHAEGARPRRLAQRSPPAANRRHRAAAARCARASPMLAPTETAHRREQNAQA